MSGTAWRVRHGSCLEYAQNGQRRVFACRYWGNAKTNQETTRRSSRREEAGCCVSQALQGEGCDKNIPGNCLGKSNRQLSSLQKWHSKEYTDLLEAQRHRCNCTTTGAAEARNSTCAASWQWENSKLRNRSCATRICVYTYSTSQHSIFQSWSICQGFHAQ